MNKKNITYKNDIKKMFDVTTFKCNNEDLNKVPQKYENESYMTVMVTKDGIPIHNRFNTLKEAVHHAKWIVFTYGKRVTIIQMTQVTYMQDIKFLTPLEQEPAEGKSERSERAYNEVVHQCKNFAKANCDAVPTGKQSEFQLPEIPF